MEYLNKFLFINYMNRPGICQQDIPHNWASHLLRKSSRPASRDGYETDFLARHTITKETKLIQVCWKISEKPTFERELRGLKKAMAELCIPSGEIVTWDDEARIDDAISITPAWKWLL